MTIYLAGPLFCQASQDWHRAVKQRIAAETGRSVVWPFELFSAEEIAAWGEDAPQRAMRMCRDALGACGLVVALLDGTQVDDGTAWEIGYAHARGIPVIGIRTDLRRAGDLPGSRVNSMIHASCLVIVDSVDELVAAIRRFNGRTHERERREDHSIDG